MKQKFKFTIYLTLIITCFVPQLLDAQWVVQPSGNNFGQTDNTNSIESIGIGDFATPGLYPLSALDVNTNLLGYLSNPPTYAHFGEVFRTDCPDEDAISTYWRMLRGGVQYGTFYNLNAPQDFTNTQTGEGNHLYIQAGFLNAPDETPVDGDIRFNTPIWRAFPR